MKGDVKYSSTSMRQQPNESNNQKLSRHKKHTCFFLITKDSLRITFILSAVSKLAIDMF